MSKKELNNTGAKPDKKLRTKELIYAGAFGALYIVLMLIIVLGTSMIPILYILAPISVGLVCGTVYMLCVLKVRKFGAALILGVLFALTACSGAWYSILSLLFFFKMMIDSSIRFIAVQKTIARKMVKSISFFSFTSSQEQLSTAFYYDDRS